MREITNGGRGSHNQNYKKKGNVSYNIYHLKRERGSLLSKLPASWVESFIEITNKSKVSCVKN